MSNTPSDTPTVYSDNNIISERREKLAQLRQQGVAFPNDFQRTHHAATLHQHFDNEDSATLTTAALSVNVAGRMMLKRVMGRASFATLQDGSGRIQLYLSDEHCGAAQHNAFKHWDIGDIVGASGLLFKTKTGELSVQVHHLRLLSKALRPLPEKFHGLTDQEQKYRQRYVDLIVNQSSRQTFLMRSQIIQAVRQFMLDAGYLEVETPMMHPIPGGATAKPFITHHNALDMPLYLRVAPELYLKRLIVGGFEKVFEINRNFRNEGISTRHNPEFTMMEFYEAYRDYRYMMDYTEALLRYVAKAVLGTSVVHHQHKLIDFSKPFQRFSITAAIKHYNPHYPHEKLYDRAWLKAEIQRLGGTAILSDGIGGLQLSLFELTTEQQLWEPTFITDYPAELSPLARSNDQQPGLTERFELFIAGREIANGFSELNDPEDQAQRFLQQVRQKDAGDDEAMHYDADYIRALEYAMPPTAGEGIGIDRLVMLLTDAASIRDVILFPHMRAED